MLRKSFVLMVMGTVIFFLCSLSSADVPHMINYQGKLTTASGGCLNDTVQMTFTIYSDSQGVSDEWSETQAEVLVKEGIFSVLLGSVDSIPPSVFDGNIKYLGVQVESDDEMRPLKPMVSVAYAYRAGGDGDWTIKGDGVYRMEGSVGIGTYPPSYSRLKVATYPGTTNLEGINVEIAPGGDTPDINFGLNVDATSSHVTGTHPTGGLLRVVAHDIQRDLGLMDLQYNDGGYSALYVRGDGRVGIGTTDPLTQLHVKGVEAKIIAEATSVQLAGIVVRAQGTGGVEWSWVTGDSASTMNGRLSLIGASREQLTVLPDGYVGIGTSNPAYELDVDGDINVSGSYNVKKGGVNYNHPDYVFEPDYKLTSLDELREYVFEKKSLPNVTSAEEVKKNDGFKMDELLIQMLEKIEEQTLYIFQLEERIAELEKNGQNQ